MFTHKVTSEKGPSAALAASDAPRRTTASTPASRLGGLPCVWTFLRGYKKRLLTGCLIGLIPTFAWGASDLQLTVQPRPNPVVAGEPLTVAGGLFNSGPDRAIGPELSIRFFQPVTNFTLALGSSPCFIDQNDSRMVRCVFGLLEPNRLGYFRFSLTPPDLGRDYTLTLVADGYFQDDPTPSNNVRVLNIQVQQPPSPACGDDFCNGDETCSSCSDDCGACPPVCGNRQTEDGETCDDGNTLNGDGCDVNCQLEPPPPTCGDGTCNGNETCATCSDDCGPCLLVCGDNVTDSDELCDDGNNEDGDGCSSICEVEEPVCGDGFSEGSEECDDGNTEEGDGCSARCLAEEELPIITVVQEDGSVVVVNTNNEEVEEDEEANPVDLNEDVFEEEEPASERRFGPLNPDQGDQRERATIVAITPVQTSGGGCTLIR